MPKYKTKYTDWCTIPNDGGWGICLRMWKPDKEVALTILRSHVNKAVLYKADFIRRPCYNGVAVYWRLLYILIHSYFHFEFSGFSLQQWLSDNGIPQIAPLSDYQLSQLYDVLEISPFLKQDACLFNNSATAKSWSSGKCKKSQSYKGTISLKCPRTDVSPMYCMWTLARYLWIRYMDCWIVK